MPALIALIFALSTAQAATPEHLGPGYACFLRSAVDQTFSQISAFVVGIRANRFDGQGSARLIVDDNTRAPTRKIVDEAARWIGNGFAGPMVEGTDLSLTILNGGPSAAGTWRGQAMKGQCTYRQDVVRVIR